MARSAVARQEFDLLPEARANARRRITDAELATLCVAQAIMEFRSNCCKKDALLRPTPHALRRRLNSDDNWLQYGLWFLSLLIPLSVR